ncbi:MAG: ferrous iron transport protein B [Desulfobulbaceae bacterium]|nr:ferrous iron transport protein B [Desulfobulbaceae bacterium]
MPERAEKVVVALSSIPNTGKTTLFNRLTGSSQTTGNWPGVSVEKKVGRFTLGEFEISLVDLPGAYALSPVTEEENIVRTYFLKTPPAVILNIIDASNLYRSLGLTLQMCTSGLPMVVAVNMIDKTTQLDIPLLSTHLGVPVIPISARSGQGVPDLQQALYEVIKEPERTHIPHISCPPVLEEAAKELSRKIIPGGALEKMDSNFLAMRLLEEKTFADSIQKTGLAAVINQWRDRVEKTTGEQIPITCAKCRFNAARGLILETTRKQSAPPDERSKCIDNILLHRWFSLPLFLLIMFLLFQAVYGLGAPLQDLIGQGFDAAEAWLRVQPFISRQSDWLQSFLFDGLWQGLGVVTSFFPIVALFFIFMSLIEDSGYMARAAFLMDHLMHRLGLDGKAFINLLLGYGCNVPAIMGTRILSSHHNRIITILLIPFTLCIARLQVFVFLTTILFSPVIAPFILFSLYLSSFIVIVLTGFFLKVLRIAGKPEPFIMEIPPYRMPTISGVALKTRQELKDFLYRAAPLIIAGVIVVWFLTHFPADVPAAGAETWAGRLGHLFSPLFNPLGIHWQETVALLFGLIAKEIVVGAMAVIYGGGDLSNQVFQHISPLQGLSFMVFTLFYTPCVATIAAIKAESGSWKITLFSLILGLVIAWLASLVLYQTGLALGLR